MIVGCYHPRMVLRCTLAAIALATAILGGCSKPEYDTSTPQAALEAMHQMIVDGHPEMLGIMVHIEPRDITYADGVTEASAIQNVIDKTGDMLGQLFRVAKKLRDRFPNEIDKERTKAEEASRRNDLDFLSKFLADPFGLMTEQRDRLTAEDLGDGTAAVLIDGQPAFGFGLMMREHDRQWKIEVPIDLLQQYRPNTREEWSVVANMMLSLEHALTQFENEMDKGQFKNLEQASARGGRLLGERAVVQAIIYQGMKAKKDKEPAKTPEPQPAAG